MRHMYYCALYMLFIYIVLHSNLFLNKLLFTHSFISFEYSNRQNAVTHRGCTKHCIKLVYTMHQYAWSSKAWLKMEQEAVETEPYQAARI